MYPYDPIKKLHAPARAIDIKYHRDIQFVQEIKGICSTELEYKEDYVDTIELITKKLNTLASQ